MKSFDSPGDVQRAFSFLRKKTWKGAPLADKAFFLSLLQDSPASYAAQLVLDAGDIAADFREWEWFKNPADLGDRNDAGIPIRNRFWNGGLKLPEFARLNGWYFVPHYFTAEFFNNARARKVGQIDYLQTGIRGSVVDDTADELNSAFRTIGICAATGSKQRVHFLRDVNSMTLTGDAVGMMFRTLLLPYQTVSPVTPTAVGALRLVGFTGLIATDRIRVTMEGRWFFSPRFIEEETTADD